MYNERDVARIAGVTVHAVRGWRFRGLGPKYRKIGAAVRYRVEDVAAWIDSRPSGGEALERKH